MARSRHVARAARAVRDHARRASEYDRRELTYAEVTSTAPLTAAVHGSAVVLDDDSLQLSQWVRSYDAQHGIDVGDTLLVHPIAEAEWVATDVVSDKAVV